MRKATCHPREKHYCKGLCQRCYDIVNHRRWSRKKGNKARAVQKAANWRKNNPERDRQKKDESYARLRQEVFRHYGEECFCCGDNYLPYLSIDHPKGGGGKHRKRIKKMMFYRWLKSQGWPRGYRTLCFNCNFARAHGRTCNPKHRNWNR